MTERFKSLILAIHDFQGSTYDLTLQGGVNALCNLINGLNNKSNRLEKENEGLKFELSMLNILYNAKCKTEEQLIEMGKEVEKENEQLKMHMKSAKAHLEGGHTKKAIERLKIIDIR